MPTYTFSLGLPKIMANIMQHDSFGSMVALQPYRTISCFDFAYLSHNCPELNLFKVQGLKEIMKIASPVINMHHLYA